MCLFLFFLDHFFTIVMIASSLVYFDASSHSKTSKSSSLYVKINQKVDLERYILIERFLIGTTIERSEKSFLKPS